MIPMSDVAINKQQKLRDLRNEMIQVSEFMFHFFCFW